LQRIVLGDPQNAMTRIANELRTHNIGLPE
jgi:hypothetical protein